MRHLILILLLCLLLPVTTLAADNITVNETLNKTINITSEATPITNQTPNTTITPNLPIAEEFYGDVTYSDNTDVLAGSQIKAMDQKGNIVGTFNMTFNGSYGDSYKSAQRLIVNAINTDDTITFYVNDIKSSKSIKFDSAGIKRADIVIPSFYKPTLTLTPTPTPRLTDTPNITRTRPTTSPTTNVVVITPSPTILPTPTPTPPVNDALPKFIGVLFIALAICVLGAVITYFILTKKMKREDEEEIIL